MPTKSTPATSGDPWTAEFYSATDEADIYLVDSVSTLGVRYRVALHRQYPEESRCSCPARVPCRHLDTARLRREIDRVEANSAALYHTWQLAELADEDERLRAVLAEADSWFVRAQLGVVGDRIAELIERQVAA